MRILIIINLIFIAGCDTPESEYAVMKRAAERNNCHGDDFVLLQAIRKAENGRPGRELGIMNPKALDTNLDVQAGWCAATIVKHHARYGSAKVTNGFIVSLSKRYCPVGADNDPDGLNQHWTKNVIHWYNRLK